MKVYEYHDFVDGRVAIFTSKESLARFLGEFTTYVFNKFMTMPAGEGEDFYIKEIETDLHYEEWLNNYDY